MLRRDHVEHVRPHVFEVQLGGQCRNFDIDEPDVWPILHITLVTAAPCGGEKLLLRLHILVRVEDDHFRFRLSRRKIERDLARPLVRSRRAAIGRLGNVHDEDAAVGHRLELSAQGARLRTCFPGVQDFLLRLPARERRNCVPDEVDARREDHAIVGQRGAARKSERARDRVDRHRLVGYAAHSPFVEAVVRHRQVGDLAAAAEHEIRQWAGHERARTLDQRHGDLAVAPLAHIFGGRRAGEAAPDHDDSRGLGGHARATADAAEGQRNGGRRSGA